MKESVGGIVSGASSVVSSGLNYLGYKNDSNSKGIKPSGTAMMGFGSDSYNGGGYSGGGYFGSSSTPYDPPLSGSDSLTKGSDKKWGSSAGFGGEPVSKAVWGQSTKYDEWKPKTQTTTEK